MGQNQSLNCGGQLSRCGCAPLTVSDSDDDNVSIIDVNGTVNDAVRNLLDKFETYVTNKEFQSAMIMIEEHTEINFFEYYFNNGNTVLHYAVSIQNASFVYYLLNKGCNTDIEHLFTDDTPIHVATRNGDLKIMTMLMKFGCKIKARNCNNQKPYDIAIINDDTDAMAMFSDQIQSLFVGSDIKLPSVLTDKDTNLWVNLNPDDSNQDIHWKIPNATKKSPSEKDTSNNLLTIEPELSINLNSMSLTQSPRYDKIYSPSFSKSYTNNINVTFDSKYTTLKTVCAIKMIEVPFILNDWLYKLEMTSNKHTRKQYKKKYVSIKDLHVVWQHSKKKYHKKIDLKRKYTYDGCLSILTIKDCKMYESRKLNSYKFIINTHIKGNKQYLFKCISEQQRNKWVTGINNYCNRLRTAMTNLDNE